MCDQPWFSADWGATFHSQKVPLSVISYPWTPPCHPAKPLLYTLSIHSPPCRQCHKDMTQEPLKDGWPKPLGDTRPQPVYQSRHSNLEASSDRLAVDAATYCNRKPRHARNSKDFFFGSKVAAAMGTGAWHLHWATHHVVPLVASDIFLGKAFLVAPRVGCTEQNIE